MGPEPSTPPERRRPVPLSLPARDLQFRDIAGQPCDVVIGLDFGTGGTKVVVRTPYEVDEPAFAVPFGPLSHSSLEYVLPTKLTLLSDDRFELTSDPDSAPIGAIKQRLIESSSHATQANDGIIRVIAGEVVATAYLALVIRHVRRWFLKTKHDAFGNRTLNWHLNVGVPSATYDDSPMLTGYQLVTRAAWLLSSRAWRINRKMAERALHDVGQQGWSSTTLGCELDIVPEVLAEAIGYAKSPLRQEGLHLIVDVGALSFDVCSFVLHQSKGTDRYSLLTADVEWLGAARLHDRRARGVSDYLQRQISRVYNSLDPLHPVPDDHSVYAPPFDQLQLAAIKSAADFADDCGNLLRRTIVHLKRARDPHSERFRTFMPVFLCGGGGQMRVYRTVLSEVSRWLAGATGNQGLRLVPLTKPQELEAKLPDSNYHRLAVAYGLSFPSYDIGDVDKPSEVADVPPPASRDFTERFVTKDDL